MLIKRISEASSEINQSYPFRKMSGGWEGVNIYPRMNFEKKKKVNTPPVNIYLNLKQIYSGTSVFERYSFLKAGISVKWIDPSLDPG